MVVHNLEHSHHFFKEKLSLGYELTVSIQSSFSVSFFRAWFLGIKMFTSESNGRRFPHGVKVNVQMRIHDTQIKQILHHSKTLTSTRDSLFWIHDMEHGSSATDPTSDKESISYLAEFLVTCFHQAIDHYLMPMKSKYISDAKNPEKLVLASHYTTKESDRVTLGPYVKYMPTIVDTYIKNLADFPELVETVLLLNGYSRERFEDLSLNAKSGDQLGFCMLPNAMDELLILHTQALKTLYTEITLDPLVKDGYGFFGKLDQEVPTNPLELFFWNSHVQQESNFEKLKRILKEFFTVPEFWLRAVAGVFE